MEPEIYFYKFLPENGYGYAEVGDTVYKVHHNDATCMAHGVTHSQATAPGYAEYYIWAIRLRDSRPRAGRRQRETAWDVTGHKAFGVPAPERRRLACRLQLT